MYNPIKIKTIYLILGNECNFKCKYCIQNESFKNISTSKSAEVSAEFYKYIKNLIDIRPKTKEKIRLIFWGGEPLIYINTIESVVSKLGNSVVYGIISNGSLLNKKTVEFLNRHDISLTISNDGSNTKDTRLINVLEDSLFCDLFKKVKNRSISSVISAYNQDIQSLKDYVYKKIGPITISYDLLMPSESLPQDAFNFNYDAFTLSLLKEAKKAMEDILCGKKTDESSFFVKYIRRIKQGDNDPDVFVNHFCAELHTSISLDINGNIFACHNSTECIANVEDNEDLIELKRIKHSSQLNTTSFKKCNNCFIKKYCQGDCKIIQPHYRGIEECCELRRIVYAVTFYLISQLNSYFEKIDLLETIQ